ncbi:hypothetical protein [Arenivirga flava]|uniref:hypothetical protein n=1 Tax=Arenivirga flava TaxID=1930060 RepID=UPI0024E14B65|nr:hypothetical protein [Arenivirga flava]
MHESDVITAVIGTITVSQNICVDGSTTTSSTGSMTWSASPLGTTAGYRFDNAQTNKVAESTGRSTFRSDALIKLCVATAGPVCGFDQEFEINHIAYSKNFVGPQITPTAQCTNDQCALRFTKIQ